MHFRRAAIYLLSLVCASLFVLQFNGWPPQFILRFEVQSEHFTQFQLLYSESVDSEKSVRVGRLREGGAAFQSISFPITAREVRSLKLLETGGSNQWRLRRVRLKMQGGGSIEIPPARIERADAATAVRREGEAALISRSSGASAVQLSLPSPAVESRVSRVLHCTGAAAMLASALVLIWTVLAPDRKSFISARAQRKIRSAVVIFLVAAYFLASFAQLNGSASALWRPLVDDRPPDAGIIAGTPKPIRSDEWVGQTPWILSQAAQRPSFPLNNPGVGEAAMPLLNNLPVRHWTVLFRPQMWAFFVSGLETAFAFYWNFKWFILLLGAFLFFRTVARGDSIVAIALALLLFFSPFVQWWFSTPTAMPEMVGAFFLALWSVAVVRQARSRWSICGGAILLVVSVAQFTFCAYPRFQIPLIYLAAFLLVSGLVENRPQAELPVFARFRMAMLFVASAAIAAVLLGWYESVAGAIHRVSALVYPGQIFSTGGGLPWQSFFTPFLEFAMTDQHYPATQMNVCEAAGFLFLAPLVLAICLRDIFRRRNDPLIIATLLFIGFAACFMLVGMPARLASASGFSRVYPQRVVLSLSIASFIAFARYLSRPNSGSHAGSFLRQLLAFSLVSLALFGILQSTRPLLGPGFVGMREVIAAAIFFALVSLMLWRREVAIASILMLIPTMQATALANPIGRGLPGFTRSETFRWLSDFQGPEPAARWLVIGAPSPRTTYIAQFLKATGAYAYGGYRCEPDLEMVQALDPTNEYASVYRRYAEITITPSNDAKPSFKLGFINHYDVLLPLRTEILDKLKVRFVLEVDLPASAGAIEKYKVVSEHAGLRLLQRQP